MWPLGPNECTTEWQCKIEGPMEEGILRQRMEMD